MKEKRKLSPLAVGDRVRVYESTGIFDGEIIEILDAGRPEVIVRHTDGVRGFDRAVFREQCRRLKPKKAPAAPERERVERWIAGTCDIKNGDPYWQEAWANPIKIGTEHIHLVELREGERILSRADLAEAWNSSESIRVSHLGADRSEGFKQLCKSLGFREEREP